MKLVLFRHADKKNELHSDPGLNPAGLARAQKLADAVARKSLVQPEILWTSPKTRAKQTFFPLSQATGLPLQSTDLLAESGHGESALQFGARIESFIDKISQQTQTVHYACSHYDWVIHFCELAMGPKFQQTVMCHHWKPGQYIEFQILGGQLASGQPMVSESRAGWRGEILSSGVVGETT